MQISDTLNSEDGVPLSLDSEEDLQSYTTFLSSPEFLNLSVSSQARVLSAFHLKSETGEVVTDVCRDGLVSSGEGQPTSRKKTLSQPTAAQLRQRKKLDGKEAEQLAPPNVYLRGFLVWFFCAIFGWVSIPTQFLPMITHAAGIGFFLVLVTSRTRWLWLVLSVLILLLVGSTLIPDADPELGQLYHAIQASGYLAMGITLVCVYFLCKKPQTTKSEDKQSRINNTSNEFLKLLMTQQTLLLEAIDKNRLLFLDTVESHQEAFRSTLTKQRDVLKQHWAQQLQFFFRFARDYGVQSDSSSDTEEATESGITASLNNRGSEGETDCPPRIRCIQTIRIALYQCWQGILSPLRPILLVSTVAVHCLNKLTRAIYVRYLRVCVEFLRRYVWHGMMLGMVVNMYVSYVYRLWESLTRDIDNSQYRDHNLQEDLVIPKAAAAPSLHTAHPTKKSKGKKGSGKEPSIIIHPPAVHPLVSEKHMSPLPVETTVLPPVTPGTANINTNTNINTTTTTSSSGNSSHHLLNFLSPLVLPYLTQDHVSASSLAEALASAGITMDTCGCTAERVCEKHSSSPSLIYACIESNVLSKHLPASLHSVFGALLQHDAHTPQLYIFFNFLLKSMNISIDNPSQQNIIPQSECSKSTHECSGINCYFCQLDTFGTFVKKHLSQLLNQVNIGMWVAHQLHLALRTHIVALNNTTRVAHTLGGKQKLMQTELSELRVRNENNEALKLVARQQAQKADKYRNKVERQSEESVRQKNDVEFYRVKRTLSVEEQNNQVLQLQDRQEQEKRTRQQLQERLDEALTQAERIEKKELALRQERDELASALEDKDRALQRKTKEANRLTTHLEELKKNIQSKTKSPDPPCVESVAVVHVEPNLPLSAPPLGLTSKLTYSQIVENQPALPPHQPHVVETAAFPLLPNDTHSEHNATQHHSYPLGTNEMFPWSAWTTQLEARALPNYSQLEQTHMDATALPVFLKYWDGEVTPLIDEYLENASFDWNRFPSLRMDNSPIPPSD